MTSRTTFFKRKIYDHMLKWKKERNGETALLLQGARRIGKSTVAEEFARNEYKSYILIDFSVAPTDITRLFEDISDLNYIFFRLQLHFHVNLFERESVIVFDEIQKAPLARQAIKHLVKDHRYDYIETGSLISVRQRSADIIIPSEETRVNMFPMDYEEFRWAMDDMVTIPLLRQAYENQIPLGDQLHRRMMRDFRLYMLVGGMPQAVDKYLKTNNLSAVDLTKREIIDLYEEDFSKIDNSGSAMAMFNSIPGQLSNNVSRFQVSKAIANAKHDRLAGLINAMNDTMTVNVAYHSNDPNVGLALTRDNEKFKMYLADTGLFITLAFMNKEFTENDIYNKLLNDKLSTNLGYVYENVIAQMLKAAGKEIYYHTIPYEGGKKYYEIDFLITENNKVSPIEVKSSGYKTHASLDEFCRKYSDRISSKYLIYTKDIQRIGDVNYIPVYMTMFL